MWTSHSLKKALNSRVFVSAFSASNDVFQFNFHLKWIKMNSQTYWIPYKICWVISRYLDMSNFEITLKVCSMCKNMLCLWQFLLLNISTEQWRRKNCHCIVMNFLKMSYFVSHQSTISTWIFTVHVICHKSTFQLREMKDILVVIPI